MPNNKRQEIKRKVGQAINNLDNAMLHANTARAYYLPGATSPDHPGYPEYAEPIEAAMTGMLLAQDVLKDMLRKI